MTDINPPKVQAFWGIIVNVLFKLASRLNADFFNNLFKK